MRARSALAHPTSPKSLDALEVSVFGIEFGGVTHERGCGVDGVPWEEFCLLADLQAPPENLGVCRRHAEVGHLEDAVPRFEGGLEAPLLPDLIRHLVDGQGGREGFQAPRGHGTQDFAAPLPLPPRMEVRVDEDVRIEVDQRRRLRSSRSYAACGANF